MDFRLTINDQIDVHEAYFDQYVELLLYMNGKIAQWNNFYPEYPLHITIEKVPSQTETIGVSVNDQSQSRERIS